jgi:Zn-dependent protease
MPAETEKAAPTSYPSPARLWAEQLAAGLGLLLAILIFLAVFHSPMFEAGMAVLGPNDLDAYGWVSVVGIILQVVVHELGTILIAWRLKLPIRFRFFGFGANADAILENVPRSTWRDTLVGFAGPLTGTALSVAFALAYDYTDNPLFLGMACVGYFYNLITLVPILPMEGGWIAEAMAPQAWLLSLIAMGFALTNAFNIVLLCVFAFALPRFVLILRARAPRTDLALSNGQRVMVAIGYIVLILGLAWFGSTTFQELPQLVRGPMGMGD